MTGPPRIGSLELIRRFVRHRGDDGFQRELARRAVGSLGRSVSGDVVLDLGCGPGHAVRELQRAGAAAVACDRHVEEILADGAKPTRALVADGRRLPFTEHSFDGVFCSNVLEHTPEPFEIIHEIERVLRPGGWVYLSWTNWLSPWGGHAIAPLHYLGPRRGLRAYRRLFGEPTGKNLPFDGVWPTYIGAVLKHITSRTDLRTEAVEPRYYPRLRFVMNVPGLREVVAWNCVLRLTKPYDGGR